MEKSVTVADWLEGARLRTLPAAAAPVLLGTGAAISLGALSLGKFLLALIVALLLQIGVNFANDYSDGVKGTDANRVGPVRLTASGKVSSRRVLAIALACFAGAGVAGLGLVAWAGTWWMLAVGVVAVIAAWFYTGGKRPYGYMGIGLSELMVFIFFGLVATVGTTWVQAYSAPAWLWIAASGMGLCSVALLLVNNIRDIPTDKLVGKTTLTVRLGERPSRILYAVTMVAAATCAGVAVGMASRELWWGLDFALIFILIALPGMNTILRGTTGSRLLGTLRNTGLFALAYGVIVGIVLLIAPFI